MSVLNTEEEWVQFKESPRLKKRLKSGFSSYTAEIKTAEELETFYKNFMASDIVHHQRYPKIQAVRDLIPGIFNPHQYNDMTCHVIELVQKRAIELFNGPLLPFFLNKESDIETFKLSAQKTYFNKNHTRKGVNPKYTRKLEEFLVICGQIILENNSSSSILAIQ